MSVTVWFTPAAARSALRTGPLRFGDPTLIAARDFLNDLAAARRIVGECECDLCPLCSGRGWWPRVNALCGDCGGTGTDWRCRCFAGLNDYAVSHARREMLARLRADDRKLRRVG